MQTFLTNFNVVVLIFVTWEFVICKLISEILFFPISITLASVLKIEEEMYSDRYIDRVTTIQDSVGIEL